MNPEDNQTLSTLSIQGDPLVTTIFDVSINGDAHVLTCATLSTVFDAVTELFNAGATDIHVTRTLQVGQ